MVGLRMLQCGSWFRFVLCGVFVGKKIIGVRERTVVELEAFSFKTFYHWAIAFDFNISSFFYFLFFFYSFPFCYLGVSLVYFMCTWVAPLRFLNKFAFTYQ
jgi:hypothetical protein